MRVSSNKMEAAVSLMQHARFSEHKNKPCGDFVGKCAVCDGEIYDNQWTHYYNVNGVLVCEDDDCIKQYLLEHVAENYIN